MEFPMVEHAAVILVDMQEKLVKAVAGADEIIARQKILLEAATHLNLDVITTEQYPQGLGYTIPELKTKLNPSALFIEKKSFSCFGEPAFNANLGAKTRRSLALIGVETHVCVLQTALDACQRNYQVFVLEDAVSSRAPAEKTNALALMRQAGAVITTVEAYLFMLMRHAGHPAFKSISKLVR